MKGYRKERKIVNTARAKGCLAFRSAGSHSPIDVVVINKEQRKIEFIQCKAGELSGTELEKIISSMEGLDGTYTVSFFVA